MLYFGLFLAALGIGLYMGMGFLKNVQPTGDEVEEDLKELKAKIADFKGGFVPWTAEISANEINQILTKDNTRTGDGVFLSVDNDPIFAYAYKNYIGPGQNAVIYILSLDHEYIFRITNKGVAVTIDNENKGLIRENGIYYNKKNDEIAALKKHAASDTHKIYIGGEEVAKIALPEAIGNKTLDIVKIDLQPLEEEIIRTYTVYQLVNNLTEKEA